MYFSYFFFLSFNICILTFESKCIYLNAIQSAAQTTREKSRLYIGTFRFFSLPSHTKYIYTYECVRKKRKYFYFGIFFSKT